MKADEYEYRIIQNNPVESGSLARKNFPINANTQLGVKKESFSNPFAVSPNASADDLEKLASGKCAGDFVFLNLNRFMKVLQILWCRHCSW